MPEKTVKMRCTIGSLAGRTPEPVWSKGEIFDAPEDLAEIFEQAGCAVRLEEPAKEPKKGGK